MYSRMQNSKFYEYRARKPSGLLLQLPDFRPANVKYRLIFLCGQGPQSRTFYSDFYMLTLLPQTVYCLCRTGGAIRIKKANVDVAIEQDIYRA